VFNLKPGQGLGTSPSGLLGLGLAIVDFVKKIVRKKGPARTRIKENVFAARIRREDEEILTIISQFLFLDGR